MGAAAQEAGQTRQIIYRRYRAAAFPVLDGFDPDTELSGQFRLCQAGFLPFYPDLGTDGLQLAPVHGLVVLVLEGFFGPQYDLAERERNGPAPVAGLRPATEQVSR